MAQAEDFISGNHFHPKFEDPRENTEEIELTLGLSLNGRFGVDPLRAKQLKRSSSIPDFLNPVRYNDTACVTPIACAPLIRTCSLPTETEEEWRKKKQLQTLRRTEAKRKLLEKQRTSKEQCGKVVEESSCSVALKGGNRNGLNCGGLEEEEPQPPPLTQGSLGSQGSGSSGISESESQPTQGYVVGINKRREAESPTSVQSSLDSEWQPPVCTGRTISGKSSKFSAVPMKNQSNKPTDVEGAKEIVRNVLGGMPSVSTKGDGLNGKRIEGFLYGYKKGEEVRIVCVCHGSFLSPAEFVKHAGGGDVAQPLKHIVVSPTSFL